MRMSRGMPDLLRDVLRPSRAVAFETQSEPDALNAHPELVDAYKTLAAARNHFREEFKGDYVSYVRVIIGIAQHVQKYLDAGETKNFRLEREGSADADPDEPQTS